MAEVNATQLRDALAWATNDPQKAKEPSTNPFVWFWEAVQGDWNEDRSTAQILVDAGISMIPLVDQLCDIRDLIANCKKLFHDPKDKLAWLALALTLIGLFPSLGSLVKGVLKIFFGFIRRSGGSAVIKAVDAAMHWVISFLRRSDVQKYIRLKKIDAIFKWLAQEVKALRGAINVPALLKGFDECLVTITGMVNKVSWLPKIGNAAKDVLVKLKEVRLMADAHLGQVLKPVDDILGHIILKLEREAILAERAILNANNIHFRGALPEPAAVRLMKEADPPPKWLSKDGEKKFAEVAPSSLSKKQLEKMRKNGGTHPDLTEQNIRSFNKLVSDEIKGPARLYRILAPNSRAMSDCWVTEEVFKALNAAPNPKEAWRKHLAVWPHWNVDGQFVIYDVKPGEVLNVWRGAASSQKLDNLAGKHLEGGWEQVIFNIDRKSAANDTMRYYKLGGGQGTRLEKAMSQKEVDALTAKMSPAEQKAFWETHIGIREKINHPNISGPFDTGWGYTDFDGAGFANKIGLPDLPGQLSKLID